jgi:hypothetical protein
MGDGRQQRAMRDAFKKILISNPTNKERKELRVVSQGSHQVVTDDSGGCHRVITDDSGGCHRVVTDDSVSCHKVVTDDSSGCRQVVTDDSACSHVVVAYYILTTHCCHLGHESSLLLSESSQCRQFESRKLPEFLRSHFAKILSPKCLNFYKLPVLLSSHNYS